MLTIQLTAGTVGIYHVPGTCVCVCVCVRERVWERERVAQLCSTLVTPWTVALQAPLSMGFSRQVCWSGLPFPAPGSSPPSDEPGFPAFQVDAFLFWIHQSCQRLYDKNHVFTLISLMKKKKQTEAQKRISNVSVAGLGLNPSHLGPESEFITIF